MSDEVVFGGFEDEWQPDTDQESTAGSVPRGIRGGDFGANVVLANIKMLEAECHKLGWWGVLKFVLTVDFDDGDEGKKYAD